MGHHCLKSVTSVQSFPVFNSFGGALLPGKGEAMAHYVKEVNPLPW